jgi:2-dehydro-3-deoxygluconokinase
LTDPDAVSVRYVSACGLDPLSGQLIDFLDDAGIDTAHIRRIDDRRIGLYLISLAGHERSFHYWREASAARLLAADPASLESALHDVDMAYLSGITLAILAPDHRETLFEILTGFCARGGTLAFDGNVRPALWPDRTEAAAALERAYRLAAIALPTAEDELLLFDDGDAAGTARRLADWSVREVVVKRGADPCLLLAGDDLESIAALAVTDPVDTSGAGDSFNGAYLAARLAGHAPSDAVTRAHAVAARVIRTRGAIVPMPILRAAHP